MRTWHVYHRVKKFGQPLQAPIQDLAKTVGPLVRLLITEADEGRRAGLYRNIVRLRPEMFKPVGVYLKEVLRLARADGYDSVLSWVNASEEDPIDWERLTEGREVKRAITTYTSGFAERKRAMLGKDTYFPWDNWYVHERDAPDNPYTMKLANNYEESLEIIDTFYRHLGFGDIFSQIEFIPNDYGFTAARINYHPDGKWVNQIYVSQEGSGAQIGTIMYLTRIAHEVGHVIQSLLNERPSQENYLPPNPLSEMVSMFFERLFLSRNNLTAIGFTGERSDQVLKHYVSELSEELCRTLCMYEFEKYLYDSVKRDHWKAADLSRNWKDLNRKYYGFDPVAITDHGWQRHVYYLIYYPFKVKSYIIGSIFSRSLIKSLATQANPNTDGNARLRSLLVNCSNQGCFNTWKDYQNTCQLPRADQIDFIREQVADVLTQPIA